MLPAVFISYLARRKPLVRHRMPVILAPNNAVGAMQATTHRGVVYFIINTSFSSPMSVEADNGALYESGGVFTGVASRQMVRMLVNVIHGNTSDYYCLLVALCQIMVMSSGLNWYAVSPPATV